MRVNAPPYAAPASPVKRISGYGCGSADSFKSGGAKCTCARRTMVAPGPSPRLGCSDQGLADYIGVSYLQSAVPIKGLDPVQLAHAHLVIRAQCEVHPLKAVRSNKNDVTRRPGLSICFTKDSWPIHRMVLSFPYSSSSSIFRNSPTGT